MFIVVDYLKKMSSLCKWIFILCSFHLTGVCALNYSHQVDFNDGSGVR